MTGERFFDLLMGRLGRRQNPELRALAVLEAQQAQENELEGDPFLPWFLITENATATLDIGERRVEVPTDFLRELEEEGGLSVIDGEGIEHVLEKKTFDENMSYWGAEATAEVPQNYSLVGKYFMIFPLPELELTIKMRYYARDAAPADNSNENLWLKHASDLLLASTGYVMASKHIRDDEKVGEFSNDKTAARGRLIAFDTAQREANMERRMG